MGDHKLEEEIEKVSLAEPTCEPAKSIKISCVEEDPASSMTLVEEGLQDENVDSGFFHVTGSSHDEEQGANEQDSNESDDESKSDIVCIGDFQLGELIAEGSVSRIHRATNPSLSGEFALKLISQDLYRNEAAAARLLKSLEAASHVSNPNLATIYDSGRTKDGSIYIVTDCLKGRTLKELIADDELLNSQRFIEIFRQVSQALKTLHHHNIVHGDLKPSNIFLIENEGGHDFVKLVDFGIAGAFTEDERLEYLKLSSKEGCPNYMSPEQCLSFGLDARSDVYSMGLVMHEALTGSPLVDGHSQVHALLKQLNLKPATLRESGLEISEPIEKIVMKCLEKNRSSRYFAIEDLELDLELAANDVSKLPGLTDNKFLGMEIDPKSSKWHDAKSRKRRRRRVFVLSIIGSIVVSSSITAGAILRGDPNTLRHQAEDEMARGIQRSNSGLPGFPAYSGSYDQGPDMMGPMGPPSVREAFGPRLGQAQRNFRKAEELMRRSIISKRISNAFSIHKDRHGLSQLQTVMGEFYLKDQYNDDGTRRDRNEWFSRTNEGEMTDLATLKLYPAFPGLFPQRGAFPDYAGANTWFDKANKTLKGKQSAQDLNLLWDRAYTKFQLDNRDPEVIEVHRKIVEILQKQDSVDKNSLLMAYRNMALIYLMNGEAGKAVHELKESRKIDEELNKIPGPYSIMIRVELAFAFLKEGKADVAEQLARANFPLFPGDLLSSGHTTGAEYLNQQVFIQALRSQGKLEEARAFFNSQQPIAPIWN